MPGPRSKPLPQLGVESPDYSPVQQVLSPTPADIKELKDVQRTQEAQAGLINRLRVAGEEHDQEKLNDMLGKNNRFLNPPPNGSGRKRKSRKTKRKTRKGGRRRKSRSTRRR